MKGDFTRSTHQPGKYYAGVLMQQGRVTLDADWNAQFHINDHRWRVQTVDTIGRACAPVDAAGFGVSFTPDGTDLVIGEGRIYVDGLLVENRHGPWVDVDEVDGSVLTAADPAPDGQAWIAGGWVEVAWADPQLGARNVLAHVTDVDDAVVTVEAFGDLPTAGTSGVRLRRLITYRTQPFFPATADPPFGDPFSPEAWAGQRHLVFLDVWRRHVTVVEDGSIREVALGGPDTATRVQTAWAVRLLFEHDRDDEERDPLDVGRIGCQDRLDRWDELTAPSGGRMSARAEAATDPEDPCLIKPAAGYRGLENRLYRVEIHEPGPLGTATFKWSRDNGSILQAITDFPAADRIQVRSLGKDRLLRFRADDRVEVLSDDSELSGRAGTMAAIVGQPDESKRILTLDTDVTLYQDHRNPKVRRWDQPADPVPTAADWVELEDGVQVRFKHGPFQVGDYWLIPARVATGDVEGFIDAPPRGVDRHFARLALVTWSGEITDCRHTFPPLCGLPRGGGEGCATVTVGDGVSSVGDVTDIQAAIDAVPPEGPGRVSILPGTYVLSRPLEVRHARLTLSGCGPGTVLVAGEQPALRVAHSRDVRVESLTVEARAAAGAVLVEDSTEVAVEDCAIVNGVPRDEVDAADRATFTRVASLLRRRLEPAGPGVAVSRSVYVWLRRNRLLAAPAASLQAQGVGVIDNLARGSLWLRDGSWGALIRGNDVTAGRGPGVALGGVAAREELSTRSTGVRFVEISHNRITGMSQSGVTTVSHRVPAPDVVGHDVIRANLSAFDPADFHAVLAAFDEPVETVAAARYVAVGAREAAPGTAALALGDVTDITVADNLVADCSREPPDRVYEPEAGGGVVLREVSRAAIHRNDIVRNGPRLGDQAGSRRGRACGIALFGCEAVDISDNHVADNGGVGGRFVSFTDVEPGEGPNPLTVQEFTFALVRADSSRVVPLLGLLVPHAVTISLPEPVARVEVALFALVGGRATAVDVAGAEVATRDFDRGWPRLAFEGDDIASLRVEANPADQPIGIGLPPSSLTILSVCAGDSCRAYQAGIVGVALAPDSQTPASPAIRVHDNVVSAPAGQALLLDGVGSMSVSANHLSSLGVALQSSRLSELLGSDLPVEWLPKAVYVFSAGQVMGFGNRQPFAGSTPPGARIARTAFDTAADWSFSDALGLPTREPTEAVFVDALVRDQRDRELNGRILFHGNQVVLRLDTGADAQQRQALASVGVASFDDVAVLDNQLSVELPRTVLIANAIASGVTLRVADNRFTEPIHQAVYSLQAVGAWLVQATGNQATHCVMLSGGLDAVGANQVLLDHIDERACAERRFAFDQVPNLFELAQGEG